MLKKLIHSVNMIKLIKEENKNLFIPQINEVQE